MNSEGRNLDIVDTRTCRILLNLVDHLDAMVAYWNIDRVCVFANEAYRDWFGVSRRELIGKTMEELLGPLYPLNLPYIEAAYAGEVQTFERDIPAPDGSTRSSLATYTPHVVAGRVHGMFVHVADVTPLKNLEHELRAAKAKAEQLATHDFLTGLPNRVLLEDRMIQALARSKRTGKEVAVVSVDLDDFKKVNDVHGHLAGDRLLIQVAARLERSLREHDSATRMGGDEFLLLLPEVESPSHVEVIAGRIMEGMRKPFHLGTAEISLGLSMGIALGAPHGATPATLLAASDRALYEAKSLGKNRFAFAEF